MKYFTDEQIKEMRERIKEAVKELNKKYNAE